MTTETNNPVDSNISIKNNSNGVSNLKTNLIIVDGKQIKVGQTFFVKSTFMHEPYKLTLDSINNDNSVNISYSEIYLGRPCSSSNKTSSLNVSSSEKCLFSTTCDASEKICFTVNKKNKNIILKYSIDTFDSGI